jgi:hypothetical protein
MKMQPGNIITLTTDFGDKDGYVGAVKGVLLKINPNLKIMDITHDISPFNVLEGALVLNSFYRFFPRGTIHLVVVDPGVGGRRKGILIQTDNCFLVGPDNGVFSFVYEKEKIRQIVELTSSRYFLQKPSSTFHARDIFAPVSAYLSLGVEPKEFGPSSRECYKFELPQPQYRENRLRGKIIYIDRFGNLISNISSEQLPDEEERIQIKIGQRRIKGLSRFYAEKKEGELTALIGSTNFLEVAVNQGNAQRLLKAKIGDKITLEKIKK